MQRPVSAVPCQLCFTALLLAGASDTWHCLGDGLFGIVAGMEGFADFCQLQVRLRAMTRKSRRQTVMQDARKHEDQAGAETSDPGSR